MDKFEKLKATIEEEYKRKKLELERIGEDSLSSYKKQGWRDCLHYLLSKISLIENVYQYRDTE